MWCKHGRAPEGCVVQREVMSNALSAYVQWSTADTWQLPRGSATCNYVSYVSRQFPNGTLVVPWVFVAVFPGLGLVSTYLYSGCEGGRGEVR